MAHRRMLSRRISQSKKVNLLSLKSQIVWTWTFPYLDDYGCFTADAEDIKTEVFPKNKKITLHNIEDALVEIRDAGLIYLYIVNNKPYQQYAKFDDFQTFRADRTKHSEYPNYDNGIPVGDTDTHKLSKVKLSKVKLSKVTKPTAELSKQPFEEPTTEQKLTLSNLHATLIKPPYKFNLYNYMSYVNKKLGYFPPVDSIINISNTAIKNKKTNLWGYFNNALKDEFPKKFADLNEKQGKSYKNEPTNTPQRLKDIFNK